MPVRGIRGAITVDKNEAGEILAATRELLQAISKRNNVIPADVAAAIFTVTADLDAAFPATAARQLGWQQVPLFCAREIPVPGSLPRCIRALILLNTSLSQEEIQHVYLRDAVTLRPDLDNAPPASLGCGYSGQADTIFNK